MCRIFNGIIEGVCRKDLNVVKFVTAKASQSNNLQQSHSRNLLISPDLFQVEDLVPNQVKPILEIC
jgi:hypothetical protein